MAVAMEARNLIGNMLDAISGAHRGATIFLNY
jgi:hypothetical protein